MSRLRRVALPRRRARLLAPDPWPRAVPGAASPIPSYLGSECEIILRICSFPGGFTRPTGDLGLQLYRRTDHVETRSPPYVVWPYCSCVLRIREIEEDELPELVEVVARRDAARACDRLRLRRLAAAGRRHGLDARGAGRRDGRRRLRAHRLAHAAAPRDRRRARAAGRSAAAASGSPCSTRSRAGPATTHATELEGPVSEDDEGSLAWAAQPRLHGGRTQLAARARPDRGGSTRAEPAGRDRDRHLGRAAGARGRHVRGRPRGRPGHPGRGGGRHRHPRGVAEPRHAGRQRRPERGLRRGRRTARCRLREALTSEGADRPRLPRPHRRQARAPRPRDRGRAQAHADRVGEGQRLHVAADLERGAERADPAPERAARIRPRAGRRDRARASIG